MNTPHEDLDKLSVTALDITLDIKRQRDELLAALTEVWCWVCRNGLNAADNGATVDTWSDVHAMVTSALSSTEAK